MMDSSFKRNRFTLLFLTLVMGCECHGYDNVKLRPGGWLASRMKFQRSASACVD
jgi:hypothetical protein